MKNYLSELAKNKEKINEITAEIVKNVNKHEKFTVSYHFFKKGSAKLDFFSKIVHH